MNWIITFRNNVNWHFQAFIRNCMIEIAQIKKVALPSLHIPLKRIVFTHLSKRTSKREKQLNKRAATCQAHIEINCGRQFLSTCTHQKCYIFTASKSNINEEWSIFMVRFNSKIDSVTTQLLSHGFHEKPCRNITLIFLV